ncbi:nitric oxide reductase large subunit [Mizugakiibacter sediminis]|uniref:Nitric oxide reductase large subunit n=1 Tax=Mizugakiibacter sediminis TaxID=1475481 RepID=A0A0K8QME8_9GAMM|nr:nitric-oxide reductase large subunit [Mizugakiibacter sediminis]GAP65602.1 nitric oxide reductase large subunit [Mizugakiibacter sediminis]
MNATRKLWTTLGLLLAASFAVLLWMGREIYHAAPPLPERVVDAGGRLLYTRDDILAGRDVWQTTGGQQLGSIWGHGAYVAPDWSADWLHREALALLERMAQARYGEAYAALDAGRKAGLEAEMRAALRPNTYDAATGTLTVSDDRAAAIREVAAHYEALFGSDPALAKLREDYAMRDATVDTAAHRHALTAFFFWSAWAAVTGRPGAGVSYTQNWPYDPLVGNEAPPSLLLWSVFSVLFLVAGIGALAWHHAARRQEAPPPVPAADPLAALAITPSMRATAKYFWLVIALFLVQILLGATTAHYQVEGQMVYGMRLADVLPYALTRTWHTELAVLWIATAWLATGLLIAPAIGGREPRFQRLGVNVLFGALVAVVVGAFAGQWFGVMQKLGLAENFWFGHQGWEYTDLGRVWQIGLFAGLLLWLFLVGRALWPALRRRDGSGSIVGLLFLSTVAIALFYGAALMWGRHTHIAMVEYWRWWVVHLWVEGFFEVFATAVIAFLFTRFGLVRAATATASVLFATIVFMAGGVLGTFHHLYFTGTPTAVIALGASFSALEVVPLALIGFEAWETWKHGQAAPWMARWRWPLAFFVAVAFWNLVGAGLFGFLINPPLSLYYMQGLNLTALHGHTALFGVYGMLGIGLMLFCLRLLKPDAVWNDALLGKAFWAFNLGLALMALLTLLPMGVLQLEAVLGRGYWFARSEQFMQQPIIHLLVWLRVPGDTIFSIGALLIGWFTLRLWIAPRTMAAPRGEPLAALRRRAD